MNTAESPKIFRGQITFFNQDRVKKYSVEFTSSSLESLSNMIRGYIKNEGPHWVILEARPEYGIGVSEDDSIAYVYQKDIHDRGYFLDAYTLLYQVEGNKDLGF